MLARLWKLPGADADRPVSVEEKDLFTNYNYITDFYGKKRTRQWTIAD